MLYPVPPLRSESASLRDDRVVVAQGEKDGFEFRLLRARLERLLAEVVESLVYVGVHSRGRFVGYLNGRFQYSLSKIKNHYKQTVLRYIYVPKSLYLLEE